MAELRTGARLPVIDERFCSSHPLDLTVKKKIVTIFSNTYFQVFDANKNLLFQVKADRLRFHTNRILFDAADSPIATMCAKKFSWSGKWTIQKGDSKDETNLLFSVKESSKFQLKTNLDVFLPRNVDEDVCDFHVKPNYWDKSCKIYKGDKVIAEVVDTQTGGGFFFGKHVLSVRVEAGVDYAFVVSLLVILDAIKDSNQQSHQMNQHH
ncbi:protein LURP-one-related 10-like [Aristolochia californica]|uniref:protein LURP-one-related 10-like n=1 Tax=Aristolochia californica TaxID=171875 RepID=UPI0035E13932